MELTYTTVENNQITKEESKRGRNEPTTKEPENKK